jgi:hypothetical protein
MTSTELLIEAVEYSFDEDDLNWWDIFDSKAEALRILGKAIKEEPEDHQIGTILTLKEEYIDENLTAEENYLYILKILRRELKESDE